MSENVFNIVQLGKQSGTFTAPAQRGAGDVPLPGGGGARQHGELDRASTFPERRTSGRNVRNRSGSGYHGLRGSTVTLASQVRYEDVMDILEMCFAGGVTPTGTTPTYTWVYTYEERYHPDAHPVHDRGGQHHATQSQMRMRSCLVNSLTIGFEALTAPGAFPWAALGEVSASTARSPP